MAVPWKWLCVVMFASPAVADVVIMKNGDRLTGTVTRFREGKLDLSTSYAGTVTIDADAVESLVTESEVTVLMKDYTRLIGRLGIDDGRATVTTDLDASPTQIDAKRVASLEIGRKAERDWQFTGRVNLGVTDTEGNTDIRRYNLDLDGNPAPGRRSVDRQLIVSLGYCW